MQKATNVLDVTTEEIARLIRAVRESNLDAEHKNLILTMIDEIVAIKQTNQEKMAALRRLRRAFEKKSEKRSVSVARSTEPRKGHGRLSADDFHGATVISHFHPELKAGDVCPLCAHGTLQKKHDRKTIRLIGNAPITAEIHSCEQFRCSGCGEIITTALPPEVGDEKATASAHALVAVFRYGLGIPHFRLATIQKALGVPLPASTQYEMVEMLWTKVVPVYKFLLTLAADSPLFFVDDTPAKVLELIKAREERKAAGERVGIFTTAMVARAREHEIHLFFTGWKHAGENLSELLSRRDETLPTPMQMSDALSRNVPKACLTIVTLCLIHGRRNFVDCDEAFPDETTYVLDRIGQVYKNERHVKQVGMTDQQRLEYHVEHSGPVMAEIRQYAEEKLRLREVEPNSVLGGAFQYLLKHWDGLTKFLQVPGAPLDNNDAERLIKKSILHRKNSLFYKTENGAQVGDVLMSLIQTYIANDTNPFDSLTALQNHSRHVAKHPHLWHPWNYVNTLRSVGPPESENTKPDTS